MNKKRILIIERDMALLEVLETTLTLHGYIVITVANHIDALSVQAEYKPDLIMIDATAPDYDALELCREMSQAATTPIIIMADNPGPVDRILMLEIGADDYLVKPFNNREMLARIKSIFRRIRLTQEEMAAVGGQNHQQNTNTVLRFGNLTIDEQRHEVTLDDRPLRLRPQEYDLLLFFARHRGITVARETIFDRVWQSSDASSSRTVDVHVRWLRQKIEEDTRQVRRIVSVRGIGYRFDG